MVGYRLKAVDPGGPLRTRDYERLLKSWQLDLRSLQQTVLRDGARVILNVEGICLAAERNGLDLPRLELAPLFPTD